MLRYKIGDRVTSRVHGNCVVMGKRTEPCENVFSHLIAGNDYLLKKLPENRYSGPVVSVKEREIFLTLPESVRF